MSATMTQLLSSGEFYKLCYDTIPVKSTSANLSFYTSNSKMSNFELWHSCRKWAIWFTLALYVGKLLSLQCSLLTSESKNLESSGMGCCVKRQCYSTGTYRLSLNTSKRPIFSKQSAFVLRWKYQTEPVVIKLTHLKTKRRPLYLKTQSVPRCKHFSSRL